MNTRFPRCLAATLLLVAGGCGDLLKQPYPAKAYFGIEPGLPDVAAGASPVRPDGYINRNGNVTATTRAAGGSVLLVRPIRVAPPFDGLAFVYRDGPAQYTTDYYANFVAPPSPLLTGGLTDWLERAGPVPVVSTGTTVRADLVLDGSVTRLVIDRTDRMRPRAVIAARFFVTRDGNGAAPIVSDTTYEVAVPVTPDTPAGYADGWGRAWRQVLERLAGDLGSALPGPG